MKTTTVNLKTLLCEKYFTLWSSCCHLLLAVRFFTHAQKKTMTNRFRLLHVNQAIRGGLSALISSAPSNRRKYAAVVCAGLLAPASQQMYHLFDETVRDNSWYYLNNYYLLFTLGKHSFYPFFLTMAIFLIAPKVTRAEYWAAPFIGYPVIHGLMLMQANSLEEFHYHFNESLAVAVVITGLTFTLGINYFSWIEHHRERAFESRIDGMLKVPGISADEKLKHLNTTWEERKSFKKAF